MFRDEQSGLEIHADLNTSVIRATLRAQDLVPAFLDVIKETPEYIQIMFQTNPPDYIRILTEPFNDNDPVWESEDMSHFLDEVLWDILNQYAPEGYYFGANEGDMSDFGYWEVESTVMDFELYQDDTLVCSNCGSDDVELKVWRNMKTGVIDDSGATETGDTWCNTCQGHHGIEYKKLNVNSKI